MHTSSNNVLREKSVLMHANDIASVVDLHLRLSRRTWTVHMASITVPVLE